MPPPPVTPSAHRFLTKTHTQQSSTKAAPTHHAQQPELAPATPSADSSGKKRAPRFDNTPILAHQLPSGGQFASTPRFSFARPPSPKRPRIHEGELFQPPRRFFTEDIDREINSSSPLNDDEDVLPSHRPVFLPPSSSSRVPVTAVSDTTDVLPLHPTRPIFLQPTVPTPDHIEPLPEAFSPHRRGQKFVSGGMAAEVRQWILDTSQTSLYSRRTGSAATSWQLQVIEWSGSFAEGAVLVWGRSHDRDGKFLLPSAGKTKSDAAMRPGAMITINHPSWEVDVDGEKWLVAPDWQVLS